MISRWQEPQATTSPDGGRLTARRVLITGASGFIGGHLARRLADQGIEVAGLVRQQSSVGRLQSTGVQLRQGDVTDPESLRGAVADVDVVFHLAGVIKSLGYDGYRRVNEEGVKHLLSACARRTTPPTVVLVSSLAAAGPAPADDRPRVEEDPIRPVSNYGRSKRAGELVAQQWADRLPITIVRPAIVFGEHDPAMLSLFQPIRRFGFHAVPGYRPRRLSLIHADDLTPLLLSAAENGRRLPATDDIDDSRGYYFAASAETPTMAELGALIGEAAGCKRVLILHAPDVVAWCIGAGNELVAQLRRSPTIVGLDKIREATAGSWTCSSTRAQRELGFGVQTPLLDRLRQTAEFYLSAGWMS